MKGTTWTRGFLVAAGIIAAMACGGRAGEQAGVQPPPAAVPPGTIVAFYGLEVPPGWVLCDGSMTASGKLTPDLRNRFIMGLEPGTGALGETGGSLSHTHGARLGRITESTKVEKGDDEKVADDDHVHPVTVDAAGHLPPYVKLVYIMKE